MENARENARTGHCPTCGQPGKPVKPVTLQSLLRAEARRRMPAVADWRFCPNPDCATVYFAEPEAPVFGKDDLTVRVGIKETTAPRPICYCFNHTIEEVEDEVRRTGKTTVLDDIKTRMQEACWCETKSPLGSCCLATVTKYVKAALETVGPLSGVVVEEAADCCASGAHAQRQTAAARGAPSEPSRTAATGLGVPPSGGSGGGPAKAGTPNAQPDCCSTGGHSKNDAAGLGVPPSGGSGGGPAKAGTPNLGRLSLFGGLFAAVLASACCWLPLLLLAFGVSGVAVSATFEKYRPLFATLTFGFLAAAFYFAYRPKPKPVTAGATAGGGCCATPAATGDCCPPEQAGKWTLQKFNRAMLWVVTAIALAFVFFPNYIGAFLGNRADAEFAPDLQQVVLSVEGMDCPACAAALEEQLQAVPGVAAARVDYEKKEAVIGIPNGAVAPTQRVKQAIAEAGFRARFPATKP